MVISKKFKIRCYAIGTIMTEPKVKNAPFGLSQTCISYVHEWIKDLPEFYGNNKIQQKSKYTDKGLLVEADSIDFTAKRLGWEKYEIHPPRAYNEFIEGQCDVLRWDYVTDLKNSWDRKTFPLFYTEIPEKNYYAQLQGYMDIYERENAELIYTLMNAPEQLIEQEARRKMYELGLPELDEELYNEFYEKMTFDHVPEWMKIKRFEIQKNRNYLGDVYKKVINIQGYINSLPNIETLQESTLFNEMI
jgi:hypothetical protein